jgi:hypothetical protein
MQTRSCQWNSLGLAIVNHASSAGHSHRAPQRHHNLKMEMAKVVVKVAEEITAGLNQQRSCAGSTTRSAAIQVHQTGQLAEDKAEMSLLLSQCCRLYPLRDITVCYDHRNEKLLGTTMEELAIPTVMVTPRLVQSPFLDICQNAFTMHGDWLDDNSWLKSSRRDWNTWK